MPEGDNDQPSDRSLRWHLPTPGKPGHLIREPIPSEAWKPRTDTVAVTASPKRTDLLDTRRLRPAHPGASSCASSRKGARSNTPEVPSTSEREVTEVTRWAVAAPRRNRRALRRNVDESTPIARRVRHLCVPRPAHPDGVSLLELGGCFPQPAQNRRFKQSPQCLRMLLRMGRAGG